MSYFARKRDTLCLAVIMIAIAAFAIGMPPGYALLIASIAIAAMIVDHIISFLRKHHRE